MAKSMMQRAGVPVVPGYHGESQAMDALLQAAQDVGFPLLVKAAMGGGGKGMKLATRTEDVKVHAVLCQLVQYFRGVGVFMACCNVAVRHLWTTCAP